MAQIVGYFEDNVTFTEGPFVLVNINGWRIEVELEGHHCPVLPSPSIYQLREELGWPAGKTNRFQLAKRVCDQLNEMVRKGKIVKRNRSWEVA